MSSMTRKLRKLEEGGHLQRKVEAMEREMGELQILLKHVLRSQGRSLVLSEAQYNAAVAEPKLEIVYDERKDLLVLRFFGEKDAVGLIG